jgi:hypothetical protein
MLREPKKRGPGFRGRRSAQPPVSLELGTRWPPRKIRSGNDCSQVGIRAVISDLLFGQYSGGLKMFWKTSRSRLYGVLVVPVMSCHRRSGASSTAIWARMSLNLRLSKASIHLKPSCVHSGRMHPYTAVSIGSIRASWLPSDSKIVRITMFWSFSQKGTSSVQFSRTMTSSAFR